MHHLCTLYPPGQEIDTNLTSKYFMVGQNSTFFHQAAILKSPDIHKGEKVEGARFRHIYTMDKILDRQEFTIIDINSRSYFG